MTFKTLNQVAGWLTFAIAAIVFALTAEPTGSLWDCGEFIAGAYKLEVVHPPGAPLFMAIGQMFTFAASLLSDNPEHIAYAINLLSGLSTAFAAAFVCWTTIMFADLALRGRRSEAPTGAEGVALALGGLVAGLSSAFITSVWFSAVEGEVYAMALFFTAATVWGMAKWYYLEDKPEHDRWIVFAIYMAGLSIGVHLLSLLTFPALALLYYHKKFATHTWLGRGIAAVAGFVAMTLIQKGVIVGIPTLWAMLERLTVNGLGLPQHSGLVPLVLLLGAGLFFGLRYAEQHRQGLLQKVLFATVLILASFSTIGIIMIRATANTPINMNKPSNVLRLLPYVNREQYGERPLLFGPHFDARPVDVNFEDRYDFVPETGKYEVVDYKSSYEFDDADKMLLPRLGHYDEPRPTLYKQNWGIGSPPTMGENLGFMINYQFGWMYWRYFMWNFSGRQNGEQGFHPADPKAGHWITGIGFLDNMLTHNQAKLTTAMKNDEARNTYYMIPFILGIIGLLFHLNRRPEDFYALLLMFLMTGLAIIVYSNQPPNEPRERDYVLAGSFVTFAMWVGMAVPALFLQFRDKLSATGALALGGLLGMASPALLLSENWDDHSRAGHYGARDYAVNFLESCAPNAIVFTYGDNDTYPLWYVQEVENIRPDVRVVNLSLIQVDWYIDLLRRKINDSEAIQMSIPAEAYRGFKRGQIPYFNQTGRDERYNVKEILKFLAEDHPLNTQSGRKLETYLPSRAAYIDVDTNAVRQSGLVPAGVAVPSRLEFSIPTRSNNLYKGDMAMLDIIASNLWERPIYFAVTVRSDGFGFAGFDDHLQLEGLALRVVPFASPSDANLGRRLGALGMGQVAGDIVHANVMEKFRWGNFDKLETFIDDKYGPSVQSMHYMFSRAIDALLEEGKKDKALDLINKYFEAFPNFNFPYDSRSFDIMQKYPDVGAYEQGKPHLQQLAQNMKEYLDFYYALSPSDQVSDSFQRDFFFFEGTDRQMATRAQLFRLVKKAGDTAFLDELKAMFAPYPFLQPQLEQEFGSGSALPQPQGPAEGDSLQ